ncbi:MAG TPA: Flp pilus assembly protein CpaB [Burkholderiales bacterium]|nr:Flp pilus assembly protein CpaB [Burkholderiales bacterium]
MALRIFARINRMWLTLGAAVVLGLLATWLAVNYLKSREARISAELEARQKGGPTVAVVVPVKDLPRGTQLKEGLVAARPIAADLVYEEMITADQFDKIAGQRLLRAVQKGRALRRADVFDEHLKDFSDQIEPGMRAITLETDELNSISQMLRPGNMVDLYLIAPQPGGVGQQVLPLIESVKIVATGQNLKPVEGSIAPASQPGREVGYTTITVEVTPVEAARLALAQQSGRIRAVLRNPEDEEQSEIGRVDTSTLMRMARARMRAEPDEDLGDTVEFIIGGKGQGGAGAPVNINVPGLTIPGLPPAAANPPPTAQVSPAQNPALSGVPEIARPFIPNAVSTGAAPR